MPVLKYIYHTMYIFNGIYVLVHITGIYHSIISTLNTVKRSVIVGSRQSVLG